MVVIPGGAFMMGSQKDENGASPIELPQHPVTIAAPLAVATFELTFAEWDACADHGDCRRDVTDNDWGRGRQPLINVSWVDAQRYAAWLSRMTGRPYRLITEAEYEYATRAGSQSAYPWGDDIKLNGQTMANCAGCGSEWDDNRAAPVGSFPPNRFGLYDMVGNISEWVEDCIHFNYEGAPKDGSAWVEGGSCRNRGVRGGNMAAEPLKLRSAHRSWTRLDDRFAFIGFRVARTIHKP
jgi:formylglycine-generating enzyme required for sulfatase activity